MVEAVGVGPAEWPVWREFRVPVANHLHFLPISTMWSTRP